MKMEQAQCSETSAYKIQTPVNYPEENIQQIDACLFLTTYLLLLGTFAYSHEKRPTSFVMSVRPSVYPQVSVRLPLDGL